MAKLNAYLLRVGRNLTHLIKSIVHLDQFTSSTRMSPVCKGNANLYLISELKIKSLLLDTSLISISAKNYTFFFLN